MVGSAIQGVKQLCWEFADGAERPGRGEAQFCSGGSLHVPNVGRYFS